MKRKCYSNITLEKELDANNFRNFMRMYEDWNSFTKLLCKVRPFIEKYNAVMRHSSAEEIFDVTLRHLATGRSLRRPNI